MAISFDLPERITQERDMLKVMIVDPIMRSISREMDENEHERPWAFINAMWPIMRDMQAKALEKAKNPSDKPKREGPGITNLRQIILAEQMAWGDVGLYLTMPYSMLAGVVIEAVGTPEQKVRF